MEFGRKAHLLCYFGQSVERCAWPKQAAFAASAVNQTSHVGLPVFCDLLQVKSMFFMNHTQIRDGIIKQVSNIILTDTMKSQLQRILNSDLSEYKIAVSDHMTNLDHFEECLTERSAFMKNFNDLMMQELQRINKDPPNQFDSIEIKDSKNIVHESRIITKPESQNMRAVLKEIYSENSQENLNVKKQSKSHKLSIKTKKATLKSIQKAKQQMQSACRDIYSYIQITKRKLADDMRKNVTIIVQNVKAIYQDKINDLENTILSLKVENFSLNQKLRQKTQKLEENALAAVKTLNIKECDEIKQKQFSILSRMNSHLLKTNKPEQQLNQIITSPIYAFESVNRSDKGFTTDRQVQLTSREPGSQPSFKLTNVYQTTAYESESNPYPMTIKNDNHVGWKHYVCDLEFTGLKQIKSQPRDDSTRFISYPSTHAAGKQTEPNMPALLRRTSSTEQYNLPVVRPLIVSYPPVDQGFGLLKQGHEVIYQGMWKHRKFHGRGKLTLQQYSYEGQFESGLMHGRGVIKIGHFEYTGQFYQNKAQGQGTLRIGNSCVQGVWKNNLLVQRY